MKAIIFGGNGFIGSHLVDGLLAQGDQVRVFDRYPERFRPPLERVEYVTGEFGDPFAMAEALVGIDLAYHLVSSTVPGTSNLDPVADIESNLVGTVQLLEQLVEAKVQRIVFLSSGGAVYGNPDCTPIPETHRLRPLCSYAVVKVAIERYLDMYHELHGLAPVVLRASNAYGPRQGHRNIQGFISTALYHLLDGVPLSIWGDGSVVRDYVYISDLVKICLKAGSDGTTGTYNAGSGVGHSLNDVIECIKRAVGQCPETVYEGSRGFDVSKVILDVSLARTTFDWKPEYDLEEGIRRTWDWIKDNPKPPTST